MVKGLFYHPQTEKVSFIAEVCGFVSRKPSAYKKIKQRALTILRTPWIHFTVIYRLKLGYLFVTLLLSVPRAQN